MEEATASQKNKPDPPPPTEVRPTARAEEKVDPPQTSPTLSAQHYRLRYMTEVLNELCPEMKLLNTPPSKPPRARKTDMCFNCGERGHVKRDCPYPKDAGSAAPGDGLELGDRPSTLSFSELFSAAVADPDAPHPLQDVRELRIYEDQGDEEMTEVYHFFGGRVQKPSQGPSTPLPTPQTSADDRDLRKFVAKHNTPSKKSPPRKVCPSPYPVRQTKGNSRGKGRRKSDLPAAPAHASSSDHPTNTRRVVRMGSLTKHVGLDPSTTQDQQLDPNHTLFTVTTYDIPAGTRKRLCCPCPCPHSWKEDCSCTCPHPSSEECPPPPSLGLATGVSVQFRPKGRIVRDFRTIRRQTTSEIPPPGRWVHVAPSGLRVYYHE